MCSNMSHSSSKVMPARDLKECAVCTRRFTSDRVNAHEAICQRTSNIVRKRFDISQQRIAGTEVERFITTTVKSDCITKFPKRSVSGLSTNWRWKHEDLLKKVSEAKGKIEKKTKVNDLPFPPSVENDIDYVQCPHCLRPFNQKSVSPHINICAKTMCKTNSKLNEIDIKTTSSQPVLE